MKDLVLLLTLCVFSIYPMGRSNRDAYIGTKKKIKTTRSYRGTPDNVRRCSSLNRITEIQEEKTNNTNQQSTPKEKQN